MKGWLCIVLAAILLAGCTPGVTAPSAPPTSVPTTPPTTEPTPATVPSEAATSPAPTEPPDPILEILSRMTLEEKVGQLFLARCPDTDAIADIQRYHLGGYILFARDFEGETPDSLRKTLDSYQRASAIPMLIAVDEEGGTVNRVSKYPAFRDTPFLSSRELYRQGGLALIQSNEEEKCRLLRDLGINVNVAPVCDITTDPRAFMYQRSLGESPEITGTFVQTVVNVMAENGIGGILKHFPGYGNNTDTHTAIAVDARPLSQLESVDLVPFSAGIRQGCDAIMVSHVYIQALDPNIPATLSPAVHAYLRDNMGFNGVIVTDDLVMKAITEEYGVEESAVLAVLAGNDLLCASDYARQYSAVLEAVKSGRISQEALDQSVLRILRWKSKLGLIA